MLEPRDVLTLFTTPVVVFDLPDMAALNAELGAQLLDEAERVPSWKRANVGGWHSEPNLAQRAAFQPLMEKLVEHVGTVIRGLASAEGIDDVPAYRYGVTAWAMVMRDGNYVVPHDHGEAHWSLAYYLDAGDAMPAPSGCLSFVDPRRSGMTIPGLELFHSRFDLSPVTSSLAVFPGWLQHYVHAYRGARPRICISANITVELG